MPREDFERFRQLVLEDAALQEALRETADGPGFMALAMKLGAERGCHFTVDELRETLRAARREWLGRWV